VVLSFQLDELSTADKLLVDAKLEIVLRVEDHNAFFVNVLKERSVFTTHELRSMLYGELRNALLEGVARFEYVDLSGNLAVKEELGAGLETHLRRTFGRGGFAFGQVRALTISERILDAGARKASDNEAEARVMAAEALGKHRKDQARQDADDLERWIKRGDLDGRRRDMGLEASELDLKFEERQMRDERRVRGEAAHAAHLEKRLEVFRKIKSLETSKIKTEEGFRKVRLEVDRDRVLDESEWREFEDEILWRDQDRRRDRRFLEAKVDLQRDYDLKRLALLNDHELRVTEREQRMQLLDLEQKAELERVLKKMEMRVKIERVRVEAELAVRDAEQMAGKNLEHRLAVKDLEMEKARFRQKLEMDQDSALVRQEIAKLDIEEKRLKSAMGLDNLERLKAIKRADRFEREFHELELELKRHEARDKRESEEHRRRLQQLEMEGRLERDKLTAMRDLSIEHLIAISGRDQATILGDLARSKTFKGMSAEEIRAVRDPVALGRALEERAKTSMHSEMQGLYQRWVEQAELAGAQLAGAHREAADRAERMYNKGLDILAGQRGELLQAERNGADRAERIGDRAMDRMSDMAAAGAGRSPDGSPASGPETLKVRVCRRCGREVSDTENFCANCGEKMF
jgi:hypothetical protein